MSFLPPPHSVGSVYDGLLGVLAGVCQFGILSLLLPLSLSVLFFSSLPRRETAQGNRHTHLHIHDRGRKGGLLFAPTLPLVVVFVFVFFSSLC